MIAWRAMFNPRKINEVAAYIHTLRGTSPPNPKAPQGQEYSE
jgi:cytochrome c oxidase cbb3-type subunit 3